MDGPREERTGEIAEADEVDLAAACFAHGLDGWQLLTVADPFERAVLLVTLQKTIELRERLDDRLAVQIINRLGESLSGRH